MIEEIKADFSEYAFKPDKFFKWSPSDKTIYYDVNSLNADAGLWALLHELGHAVEGHSDYELDIELIKLELSAWERAKVIAKRYKINIDPDHIEDSLDTYRDWLKRRSTCPDCHNTTVQTKANIYTCFNCGCQWRVPKSPICRITRRKLAKTLK